jgi:hypothetical protein
METIYTTIYTTISNFDRDDCEHLAKTYTTKGRIPLINFGLENLKLKLRLIHTKCKYV